MSDIVNISKDNCVKISYKQALEWEDTGKIFKVSLDFVKEAFKEIDSKLFYEAFGYNPEDHATVIKHYGVPGGPGEILSAIQLYAWIVQSKKNFIELSALEYDFLTELLSKFTPFEVKGV